MLLNHTTMDASRRLDAKVAIVPDAEAMCLLVAFDAALHYAAIFQLSPVSSILSGLKIYRAPIFMHTTGI
ncbi:hypothetical protein J3459_012777 [Metarhizium acridum]|nr:hypothetical protein J3459_012777 [Metarhizium acridum]